MSEAIAEFITTHYLLTTLIVITTVSSIVRLVYGILRVPYEGMSFNYYADGR